MTIEQIKEKLKSAEYDFLRTNENLGSNIILLTLGGSHAYGMDKEYSDVDVRGISLNSKPDILLGTDFEQVVDVDTDTTIKAARLVSQAENESYILKSIDNARYEFKNRYYHFEDDNDLKLYIDKSAQEGYDSEIFMDVRLNHYPLRDWTGMWNEMKTIVSSYNKFGRRNEKAVAHDKLGKHMAHLIRLYMMCIDILEKEEIVTYREKERDLLMSIRNGEYLDENRQPIPEFYDLLNEYEKRFEYAKNNTSLPEKPDYKRINDFRMSVNERIVKGDV